MVSVPFEMQKLLNTWWFLWVAANMELSVPVLRKHSRNLQFYLELDSLVCHLNPDYKQVLPDCVCWVPTAAWIVRNFTETHVCLGAVTQVSV